MNCKHIDFRYKILVSIILFFFISSNLITKENLSGYFFAEPSTQNIQDDDFINPGFIWVERGKKIWKLENENKKSVSCNSCHGSIEKMKGVSLNYPKLYDNTGKLINLEQQINICRKNQMKQEEYKPENKDLLSLSAAITNQSRGLEQDIKINEQNQFWFNLGKELYFKKIGQMGLSCNQCHDDRVGLNLRAEKVSQGHVNGFPSYLLRWSKVVSVHKRIQYCNEQARAIPFKIFSDEYNALQLYLTWRGKGLQIETPAVRK